MIAIMAAAFMIITASIGRGKAISRKKGPVSHWRPGLLIYELKYAVRLAADDDAAIRMKHLT